MNIFFSLFVIFICFINVKASPIRKKVKRNEYEDLSFENLDQSPMIDDFDYSDFARIFTFRSKPIESSDRNKQVVIPDEERENEDATNSNLEQNREKKLSKSFQDMYDQRDHATSISTVETKKNVHLEASSQSPSIVEISTLDSIKLPSFQAIFTKPFYNQKFLYHEENHCMTRKTSTVPFSHIDAAKEPEISSRDPTQDDFLWEKLDFTKEAQEYYSRVYTEDYEVIGVINPETNNANTSLQSNHSIEEFIEKNNSLEINAECQLYDANNTKTWKKAVMKLFIDELAINCLNDLKDELVLIIQDELYEKIEEQKDLSDANLLNSEILSDLQNKDSKLYCNEFKTNNDFRQILKYSKMIVKFETEFFSELSIPEVMQKIRGYNLIEYSKHLKNEKLHLIFPESNYLLACFENTEKQLISKGCVLLVHYYYEIIKKIISVFCEDSKKLTRNESRKRNYDEERKGKDMQHLEENTKVRILVKKRFFFVKRLLSELFILFDFDPQKVKIYKVLSLIHYISTFIAGGKSYLRRYFFRFKMQFIFRFIFDSNIKFDNDFHENLISDLSKEDLKKNQYLNFKKKLIAIFHDHFCLDILIDKVLLIINTYEVHMSRKDKFNLKIEMFKQELKEKIPQEKTSENKARYKTRLINIFLELEFRQNHLEYLILSTTVSSMNFYFSRGVSKIYENLIKESNMTLAELNEETVAE